VNNAVVAVVAFFVGNGVGVGVLFSMGEFAPPPPAAVTNLTPPPAPKPPVVAPPAAPIPAAPVAAPPTPAAPVATAPVATAPVATAPTPTPTSPPAGTAPATPPAAAKPPAEATAPPKEHEPSFPYGRLVIAGIGPGSLSVSADKPRTGTKIIIPLLKSDGLATVHSPDGTFTLEVRYKAEGGALKASIDCSPMALLTAGGQTSTHLSGLEVGGGPTKVDVGGGRAGSFSFILSHLK
jgi:hypothetical protein